MAARRPNEALAIRIDNALSSTTSAPSAATDGIQVPESNRHRDRGHLELRKGGTGTTTCRVRLHGYRSRLHSQAADGENTEVASSGAWSVILDTDDLPVALPTDSGGWNRVILLEGLADFERLGTEVVTNGGTSPTLTTAVGFGGK